MIGDWKGDNDKAARLERSRKIAEESKKNRALYDAESRAVDEKTARLKALRLAREASAPPPAVDQPKGRKKPARR